MILEVGVGYSEYMAQVQGLVIFEICKTKNSRCFHQVNSLERANTVKAKTEDELGDTVPSTGRGYCSAIRFLPDGVVQ